MAERAANATDNWRVTSEAAAQAEEQFRRTQPTLQITNSEMQLMAMGAETVGRNIDAMTQIMDNRNSSILAHANALRMAAGAYADIHNAANIASAGGRLPRPALGRHRRGRRQCPLAVLHLGRHGHLGTLRSAQLRPPRRRRQRNRRAQWRRALGQGRGRQGG